MIQLKAQAAMALTPTPTPKRSQRWGDKCKSSWRSRLRCCLLPRPRPRSQRWGDNRAERQWNNRDPIRSPLCAMCQAANLNGKLTNNGKLLFLFDIVQKTFTNLIKNVILFFCVCLSANITTNMLIFSFKTKWVYKKVQLTLCEKLEQTNLHIIIL